MAIGIHVVRVAFLKVDSATGNVISKDDATTPISSHLNSAHEHRVIPDASVPNSSGYPRVTDYLKSEAADNYVLRHMDQNMIVTYDRSAINSA